MRWAPRFIHIFLFLHIVFFKVDDTSCYDIKIVHENKTKPKIEGKIVGGVPTPIERYPFAAIVFNYGALCGGSILTSWAVLTAAHCFDINDDVYDISIHVGARHKYDPKSDVRYVQHLERHKDYNKAMPFACDIAILFVEVAFSFSQRVQKALIVDSDKWMTKDQKNFTVTGWGMIRYNGPISDRGLLMAQLRFIPRDECGRLHEMTFTEDMFCLYGDAVKDTCKGDSGGGVIWNGFLVGIVSHGDGCAGKGKPSVYANVFYFRDWIFNTISEYYNNNCGPEEKKTSKLDQKIKQSADRT